MKIPIEIAVKNLVISDQVTNLINKKAAKLDRICDHITSCRVTIERPYLHQSSGNPYRVRIDITLPPGHELVAKKEAGMGDMYEPLPGVIKNAFHSAERQLKKLVDLQQGNIKTHPQKQPQNITNLWATENL